MSKISDYSLKQRFWWAFYVIDFKLRKFCIAWYDKTMVAYRYERLNKDETYWKKKLKFLFSFR